MDIITPLRFYNRGYRDQAGVRYYYGNQNAKAKKALVVASGEALEVLHSVGLTDEYICGMFLEQNGSFSRLDLAVTEWVETELVTLWDIENWVKNDLVESPLTLGGVKEVSSIIDGSKHQLETLYIGDFSKRGKLGIFRAYDKGIELDLGQYLGTRLELELRGKKAQAIAENIAYRNDFSGSFRQHFNVYADNFDRIMDAPISEPIKPKRGLAKPKDLEMDKRWRWLMEQVAPAVKDAIQYDEKSGRGRARAFNFAVACGLKYKDKINLMDTED
jgi:hypothetical protein